MIFVRDIGCLIHHFTNSILISLTHHFTNPIPISLPHHFTKPIRAKK